MGKFDGKTLLVLGTSVGSVEIVQYAKSEGARVIVTDYLPAERSAAKQFADEAALVSTTDVEALCALGKEKHIDGVISGVSEVNLLSAMAVAERLGLTCYFTAEQWNLTEHKDQFKALCEEHGVPVPYKYMIDREEALSECSIQFPVIVKPTDRSSGIGIHVCFDMDELLKGYRDAYAQSFSHKVIVEEFLEGDEFIAVYSACDGNICLSAMGDLKASHEQAWLSPLSMGALYPSKYLPAFKERIDASVKAMFSAIGIRDGYFFVQGIVNNDDFKVFECGLRLAGGAIFRFNAYVNHSDPIKFMTDKALLNGVSADYQGNDDPNYCGKKCCIMNILNKGGKIARVNGIEKVGGIPEVIFITKNYGVGDVVAQSGTLRQIQFRFYIVCETSWRLAEVIDEINEAVEILDENGDNMRLSSIQGVDVRNYW